MIWILSARLNIKQDMNTKNLLSNGTYMVGLRTQARYIRMCQIAYHFHSCHNAIDCQECTYCFMGVLNEEGKSNNWFNYYLKCKINQELDSSSFTIHFRETLRDSSKRKSSQWAKLWAAHVINHCLREKSHDV